MFALSFRFLNNCYHATPWGRDVNEAEVPWPPAPWSILRALVAVYWCKSDRSRGADLSRLIDVLADSLPMYHLPRGAVHAHTRHYMPTGAINTKTGTKKTKKTLDAFVRLPKGEEIIVAWPDIVLEKNLFTLASDLVSSLTYFGRIESWTDCKALNEWEGEANCCPASAQLLEDGDPVRLLVPRRPTDYTNERARIIAEVKQLIFTSTKKTPTEQQIKKRFCSKRSQTDTLPFSLLDAITLDPVDYHDRGWSCPPAAYEALYIRTKSSALGGLHALGRRQLPKRRSQERLPSIARFLLVGRPRPRFEDAVKLGETMRRAALAQFGSKDTKPAGHPIPSAPKCISGHDGDGQPLKNPSHSHAFWLPEDADTDGRIDHLSVFIAEGIDDDVLTKLGNINYLAIAGRRWQVALEGFGAPTDFSERARIFGNSKHWRSVTPFLASGHLKSGGYQGEVLRLLKLRGCFPTTGVEVSVLESIPVGNAKRRSVNFHRFRTRSRELQPDTSGALLRIDFPKPIQGPLALGYGCHFGLGLFSTDVSGDA